MSEPARSSTVRRPLPALAFLVGLALLTGLVWWRVIHRSDETGATASTTKTCASAPVATSTVLPAVTDVSIQVLNSTTKTGLAGTTGAALVKLGFKQAAVPTNDSPTHTPVAGVAELRFGPAGKPSADLLSFYLPGATEVADQRTGAVVDVALGAKFTAIATPDAVAAALKAAHVSVATAGAPAPSAAKNIC